MQHLVIEHVAQKPERHEWLIQRRIDPNDAIVLVNRAKNEMFSRAMLSSSAPDNLVPPKAATKVPFVQLIKDGAQIEMRSLVTQIQMPLHRQLGMSKLPFCLFLLLGHRGFSKNEEVGDYFSGLQM